MQGRDDSRTLFTLAYCSDSFHIAHETPLPIRRIAGPDPVQWAGFSQLIKPIRADPSRHRIALVREAAFGRAPPDHDRERPRPPPCGKRESG